MHITEEKEKILSDLTRAEKAELLQWIVRDLGDAFPGIESKPGAMGCAVCISRTRIAVGPLEQARRLGSSSQRASVHPVRTVPVWYKEDVV